MNDRVARPQAAGTALSKLVIEPVADLDAVRADWSRLAEASGNVFSTWEWIDCWRRHLGRGTEPAVAIGRRSDGQAAAILPLCIARRVPLRLVRLMGTGPSDELGPICAPDDRATTVEALRAHVEQTLGRSGLFIGERLWCEGWPWDALAGEVVHHASSPMLTLSGRTFDEFLAGRSRNFREQARRRERVLRRSFQLTFRLTETPEELDRDLETLIRLHNARWAGGRSDTFAGERRAFHRDFAGRALSRGWLRLWTMELDGRPVAAWYGLRFAGIDSYYQSGRDPAFDRLSAGFVLLCHTLRDAFVEGTREYRFGLGDESYKWRFAEHDPGLEAIAVTAGISGAAALAGLRQALRMPPGIRRRLRTLS